VSADVSADSRTWAWRGAAVAVCALVAFGALFAVGRGTAGDDASARAPAESEVEPLATVVESPELEPAGGVPDMVLPDPPEEPTRANDARAEDRAERRAAGQATVPEPVETAEEPPPVVAPTAPVQESAPESESAPPESDPSSEPEPDRDPEPSPPPPISFDDSG
jgi:hypothetical protein